MTVRGVVTTLRTFFFLRLFPWTHAALLFSRLAIKPNLFCTFACFLPPVQWLLANLFIFFVGQKGWQPKDRGTLWIACLFICQCRLP